MFATGLNGVNSRVKKVREKVCEKIITMFWYFKDCFAIAWREYFFTHLFTHFFTTFFTHPAGWLGLVAGWAAG